MNIFKKLDVEIDSSNIEDCHWLPNKGTKRAIIKFSKGKDANKIRHCKKKLKGMDLTSLGISSQVFINDSLCQYYKMLWRKCQKLLTFLVMIFLEMKNRSFAVVMFFLVFFLYLLSCYFESTHCQFI